MKILLANNELQWLAGSQTWTKTMYRELVKSHDVDIFTFGENKLIYKSIFSKPKTFNPNINYDLAIINHRECLQELNKYDNIKKKIFTSHGVIPDSEQPCAGADFYIAVSEEVEKNINNHGFQCSGIIRNPIDTSTFYEKKAINKKLKNILYIASYGKRPIAMIQKACINYNLEIVGGAVNKPVKNIAKYINKSDLIISLGRGAYEALSCNRNVIVFDSINNKNYFGDGFVDHDSIIEFRKNNCSGRNRKTVFNVNLLKEELLKYNSNLKMRNYILQNHDVSKIVYKYLSL